MVGAVVTALNLTVHGETPVGDGAPDPMAAGLVRFADGQVCDLGDELTHLWLLPSRLTVCGLPVDLGDEVTDDVADCPACAFVYHRAEKLAGSRQQGDAVAALELRLKGMSYLIAAQAIDPAPGFGTTHILSYETAKAWVARARTTYLAALAKAKASR